ncbi:hypothetical protein CVT26_007628 [Gymnopilus dilepis]|uniref:Uncharacterized protein n=1 Tax=Gymnopilus dilepis TaxID=231916 RepID=A0A409VZR4_9AGAR|nr:hypothetical protein CVT26_007628 [Gymnopilus dilepis]
MSCLLKLAQSWVLGALALTTLARGQAATQPTFNWTSIPGSTNLSWVDCYTAPLQCTRLNVPFNYSDTSAGEATLALIRVPSTLNGTADYRGPVLFNPGGPGVSGVDFVVQLGSLIAQAIGPQFDLVSFDPRGIENSVPPVSFFLSDAERQAFDLGPGATDATATPDALPRQWAHFQVFGHLAHDRQADFLPHVTTDNVARDMMTIVQAHGQENIRYWGISYGSVLGATFASMFPDKIERIIIDGVLDMEGYYKTDWALELLDTDKVFQAFIDGCFKAGPGACAFYDKSTDAIEKNISDLFKKVHAQPIPAYAPSLPMYGYVDHAVLKNAFFSAFYTPFSSFAPLAQGLAELQQGNGSTLFQIATPHTSEVVSAVACGDGEAVTDDPAALQKYFSANKHISKFFSEVVGIRTMCSGWPFHPNNFKGPIGGNTSFPMMLIGNTADPVTPVALAMKTSKSFPGSVVLTQDSPGHTSFTSPSECTLGHVQQYFVNGTLPPAGTVCPVTAPLFPPPSNASNATAPTRREVTASTPLGDLAEELRVSYAKVSRRWLL